MLKLIKKKNVEYLINYIILLILGICIGTHFRFVWEKLDKPRESYIRYRVNNNKIEKFAHNTWIS
jgi:hypothetical protein